ncbi:TPA: hypothetical protein R1B10_001120 [Klebsiella pneumoniae]|nr:hypothetical protein [Klebsiella pneumoniae]HCB0080076.1 hypothetical protein [Klebsiella pneumoniae]HEB5772907.1 hypothetical protein [Klebsiella pneumoniae]HEB9059494.1 hypothetical protein [Klebsiella pneumoniae]HEB9065115.1 hypothetical protein [Klebsiella pneumoniae]
MSLNQKMNFGGNMNNFAERKIASALQMAGKVLPARVVERAEQMVTVSFLLKDIPYVLPQVTIPLFGPQYIRYPMQPGDRGIVIPADTYLGGASGLGGGTADLTPPGNLSALVFLPVSHTEWEVVDAQVLTLYGPEGVTIRDAKSNTTFLLTPESITIATPQKFEVTVGSTVLRLTAGSWSLTGESGTLSDSVASTSPKIMQEGWEKLQQWINGHQHSNGNNGQNTGRPTTSFNGSITHEDIRTG